MKYDLSTLPLSNSFAALGETFYSTVLPTPFQTKTKLLHFNTDAADLLDLDHGVQRDKEFTDIFTGKQRLKGDAPLAMLYAGHQFGNFVPQLGDGRAILLAETTNQDGDKKYILRNYMAQIAIDKAERDKDYREIDVLMSILKAPFDEHPEHNHYATAPPDWANDIEVSCSS